MEKLRKSGSLRSVCEYFLRFFTVTYPVFLSKGDLYTLHLLKAFDFIDDDDSGFISKEVSESMHGQ